MKLKKMSTLAAVAGLAVACGASLRAADHAHINAGAVGVKQDDKLIFDNGSDFNAASGYVKTLIFTNGGTYSGLYQANLTLTALPQTPANAGPAPNAPASGSFIQAQLASVDGPAGSAFSFWETGATSPTYTVLSGQIGTNMWRLSSSDGSPGSDPYGHIHGRRFTATKAGIYKVGFKLFDTSTNGVGGGPIHAPSDILTVFFEADVNLQRVELVANGMRIRFAAPLGNSWQLEAAERLGPQAAWASVGTATVGDDSFHEIEDERPLGGQRFYRLRGMP